MPSSNPTTQTAPVWPFRAATSWMGSLFALVALEGLRGRTVTPAVLFTAALVLLAMALIEARVTPRSARARILAEVAGLVAASLILAWPLGWNEPWGMKIQAIVIARVVSWLLVATTMLASAGKSVRRRDWTAVLILFAFTTGSLWMYMTPNLVGPIDARWYANIITDFLAQFRAGTFPVFSGETAYAFNGAVHPFRSAPWQFDLAAAVDVATRHSLQPVAVQHATIIISYVAATLALYTGLVRLRPRAKAAAFVLTLVYASSTAITGALVMHDMYMTVMGGPFIVAVILLAIRAVETPSVRVYAWLGAACAFLWLCHPPLALLGLLLAAFMILGHLAVDGPGEGELPGMLAGAFVFGALSTPYFLMTRGLSTGQVFQPFKDIIAPSVGLWLVACGLAQALRRSRMGWLFLTAFGVALLKLVQPSLVPFGIVATILTFAVSRMSPDALRARFQKRPESCLLCIGLLSALIAESWFPRHDVLNFSVTADYVRNSAADPARYFRPWSFLPIDQPGLAVWLLLLIAFALSWGRRAAAGALGIAAAVVLVVGLGFIPKISLFLWTNFPPEFISIISVAYNLRLLPVLTPVVVAASFVLIADTPWRTSGLSVAATVAAVAMLGWALWEHGLMLRMSALFRMPANVTRDDLSKDNIVLQRYSWDLLTVPLFFSNGYMDPEIESRFFGPGPVRDARNGPTTRPLIDPEAIARSMEPTDSKPIDLVPTVDPRGAEWLYFAPKIVVAPGEKKLLRFDFMGRMLDGWLMVRGADIYHEYQLPSSGTWWGFGSEAPNSTVLPVNNSGPDPVAIEIVYKRSDTSKPVASEPYMRVWVSTYVSSKSPIATEQVTPLRMRVDAPSDGILETFRSYYPGYRVLVDGLPATPQSSYDGLLDVPLTKGRHEVLVKFEGTASFIAAAWWQMIGWTIAAIAALSATRRRLIPTRN